MLLNIDHPADSGRSNPVNPATSRPNRVAIFAYIPTRAKTAILASPKQEDLKWLTTISQNRHPTVRTGFSQAKDLAWAVWGSFSWASSSCLLCFMLCSVAQRYRLSKTQAQHPLLSQHRCPANNAPKSITLRSLIADSPTGAGLLSFQRTEIKHLAGGQPC
ncbi:hypothetical protein OA238_c20060 [Octadecabacter arcticus 238]|uniref:Uncharacterized protein n=1 Tax=Octadecabacter arcticus 238 TaxID=391616 RepID=M9RHQ0_9RHOB|nr:hypothetical protein OA238_c20060 [Octadecabacter arcticus 238]